MENLAGMITRDWLRLLAENRYRIAPSQRRRVLGITLVSLLNYPTYGRERRRYGAEIASTLVKSPVFILGHWRSGTTLLHELMALDKQFAYPNLFQVSNPHTCLVQEAAAERALAQARAERRDMDNMLVTFRSPGEDESAISLIGLRSPVLGWSFTERMAHYDRFYTFRGVPAEDAAAWKAAMIAFYRKLTWRYRRPLLLKSPAHTGRVRLLLETFPDARFVHIYRDPYKVFQSTVGLFDTVVKTANLQRPLAQGDIHEAILRNYVAIHDALFEERALVPAGQYCEVRYEDLARDMPGEVGKIYAALNLPGYDSLLPKVEAYVLAHTGYKRNPHTPLDDALRQRIATAWQRNFEMWGYAIGRERQ